MSKQADLAIFSLDELRFSGVGSALDGLITCGASQLEKLMIGGKWLIENNDYCRVLSRDVMEKYKILAKKIQN